MEHSIKRVEELTMQDHLELDGEFLKVTNVERRKRYPFHVCQIKLEGLREHLIIPEGWTVVAWRKI